jgi:hypothetical protein
MQDIVSGALIVALAITGYLLNAEHPLGTVRRMGPGYMPMLTFWILGGIGVAVVVGGMIGGPAAVGNDAWRELSLSLVAGAALFVMWIALGRPATIPSIPLLVWGVASVVAGYFLRSNMLPILAAMAVFWFTLERLGFVIATVSTVMVAGLAERPPRLERMACNALLLTSICYAIFIAGLDIRVPLLPGDTDTLLRNTAATLSGTTKVILDWAGLAAWAVGIWLSVLVLGHTLENEADSKHWGQLVLALVLIVGGFVMIELTGDRLGFVFKAIGTVLSPITGLFR